MMTTTLELPKNLRFTVGDHPQPIPNETRLTRITARQRAGLVRDGLAAVATIGLAMVIALGIAGI